MRTRLFRRALPAAPGRAGCRTAALAGVLVISIAGLPTVQAADPREAPSVATATGSGPLETTIDVETLQVEKGSNGKDAGRWTPADRLRAGEEVHYTVRVTNPGKQPVTDVVVTKRLPYGVHYAPGSATGPACEVQFSADGGKTFTLPRTPSATGRKNAPRPAVEYTHVRWIFRRPLNAGATALLRFRATFS